MPDLIGGEINWDEMGAAIRLAEQGLNYSDIPPVAPSKAPGGLVFQIVIDGQVVRETCSPADNPAPTSQAASDGNLTVAALNRGKTVELKIFDGDTGIFIFRRRMIPQR